MSNIAVIGAGSWGTTLAYLLADKGNDISLWAYEEDLAEEIEKKRINTKYLPGIVLPERINVFTQIEEALKDTKYVINVVPTQYTREVFTNVTSCIPVDALIVSASKGIEKGTLLTVSRILEELLEKRIAVLSGPGFAMEVIEKRPTAVTIASQEKEVGLKLQKLFSTQYFRVYTNTDVIGAELGGALKNVMAIASGISDGLGLGSSTRAALITRGLTEMIRLGVIMGAKEKTFSGLSGLGDLVLTCTGALSRNYMVGYKLGKGERLGDILSNMVMVAEGIDTSESAFELSRKYNVEMPIVEQIYRVIKENKKPIDAVRELMTRSLKSEY